MLESLRIRNFKRHEALDIVFPSGMTICTGKNYQGKSSVLQAILFAFFGVSAVPGGSKLVVRRGSSNPSMSVTCTFYHRNHQYTLERTFSNATLLRDGAPAASGKSAVNAELEEIFGTSQKFFMRLKYAEQGQTQALLTLGAEELHKIVEHVSGASEVNKVILKASRRMSDANARLEEVGKAEPIEPLQEQYQDLTRAHAALKTEDSRLSNDRSDRQEKLKKAEADYAQMEAQNRQIEQAVRQHQGKLVRKQTVEELIERTKTTWVTQTEAGKHADAWKDYLEKLNYRAAAIEAADSKLSDLEAQANYLIEQLDERQHDIEQRQERLAAIEAPDMEQVEQALMETTEAFGSVKAEIEQVNNLLSSGICNACGRPYGELDVPATKERLKALVEEQNQTLQYYESAKNAHAVALATIGERQEDERRIEAMEKYEIPDLEKRIPPLEEQDARIKKHRAELGDPVKPEELEEARNNLTTASMAATAGQEAGKQLENLHAELNQLCLDIDQVGAIQAPHDLSTLSATLVGMREGVAEIQQTYQENVEKLMKIKFELGTVATRIEQAQTLTARTAELTKERDTAKKLVKYLKTNRDRFMTQLWQQVTNYASEFASACTGGAIERVVRTDAGAFEFVEEGQTAPLEAASGAQKSIMSVAVQLAFDALLPDSFGALLMDEPTSQMDEDHAMALSQMLANSGRQIILVSHREGDASLAQAHVHLN